MKSALFSIGLLAAVFAAEVHGVHAAPPPPPRSPVTCMECKGTGRIPYFFGFSKRCRVCDGTGIIVPPPPKHAAPPPPKHVAPPPPSKHAAPPPPSKHAAPSAKPHNAAPQPAPKKPRVEGHDGAQRPPKR